MDIVTAGRACVRRWYLFLVVIAIGLAASLHIANATKPTYEATGSFIVLGSAIQPVAVKPTPTRPVSTKGDATPSPTPTPTPAPTTTVENPYSNDQDLLRGALQDVLNGEAFQQQIAALGYGGTFTVGIAKKQPIFDVTADARHRKEAVALANVVLVQANTALHHTQLTAGAPADKLLNTQTITTATQASDVTSGKAKRLVAGVVVSLAAAIALSIALDSTMLALRRRRTPRTAGGSPAGGAAAQATVLPATTPPAPYAVTPAAAPVVTPAAAPPVARVVTSAAAPAETPALKPAVTVVQPARPAVKPAVTVPTPVVPATSGDRTGEALPPSAPTPVPPPPPAASLPGGQSEFRPTPAGRNPRSAAHAASKATSTEDPAPGAAPETGRSPLGRLSGRPRGSA